MLRVKRAKKWGRSTEVLPNPPVRVVIRRFFSHVNAYTRVRSYIISDVLRVFSVIG